MAKIFKPRRGKKSTMAGSKKATVLSAGEMFIEVPDTGAGTGHSKMKIGDGSTQYSSLPYAMGDTENDKIAFSNDTSGNITTALNKVTSGAALKTMIAALKQAVSLANTSITQLNDDLNDRTTGKLMELNVTNVKANGVDVEFYRTGGIVHGNTYVAANQELPSGNDHILIKVNIIPLHEFTFAMVDAYGNNWLAKFLTNGSLSLSNYTGTAISTGIRLYSVGLTFACN